MSECSVCSDTHTMWLESLEAYVLCTHCPKPCEKCRVGAYCQEAPCKCECHMATKKNQPPAPQFGEPFTYYALGNNSGVRDAEGFSVIDIDPSPGRGDWIFRNEQLKRICATMNAMANIPDPQAFVREVRELMKECAAFVRERDQTDHYPDIRAQQLRNRIDDKLARLDAGRGRDNA